MANNCVHSADIGWVIIQAGGQGTRLGPYAEHRPKCLLPVAGATLIEHQFQLFHKQHKLVIADHLSSVLQRYLAQRCAHHDYTVICTNQQGTAAGLAAAVQHIPDAEPFLISWSDLWYQQFPDFEFSTAAAVGITDAFECRWTCTTQAELLPEPSSQRGVLGLFAFANKQKFSDISTEHSFVRGFLRTQYDATDITPVLIQQVQELGTAAVFEQHLSTHRWFNQVRMLPDRVIKTAIADYAGLIDNEIRWYQQAHRHQLPVPAVLSTEPLTLQRLHGKPAWQLAHQSHQVINNMCSALHHMHQCCTSAADHTASEQVYIHKPVQRVQLIQQLMPICAQPEIHIDGRWCQNPLAPDHQQLWYQTSWPQAQHFNLIHGDCTFSNMLLDSDLQVWFIDPRGCFAHVQLLGDAVYDWAKLCYSAVGNYDCLARQQFRVQMQNQQVQLSIQSQGFEWAAPVITQAAGISSEHMLAVQAGIWFSLSGYVPEDIHQALYAYMQGVKLWNQI